jgi:hypothetical protein
VTNRVQKLAYHCTASPVPRKIPMLKINSRIVKFVNIKAIIKTILINYPTDRLGRITASNRELK